MKAKNTLEEAIYIAGLPEVYLQHTPAEFWSREAFDLFQAASGAGIIAFDDLADTWTTGANYSKAALAYFCKRASKALHLNQGSHTYWPPFERMFNRGNMGHPATPLRLALHNLEESAGQEALKDRIDKFFTDYGQ